MENARFQPDMLIHLLHFVTGFWWSLVVQVNSSKESKGVRLFKISGSLILMKIEKRQGGLRSGRACLENQNLIEIKIISK